MTPVTPINLDSLTPVAHLDPAAHRHHDVLAAVLDMFCQLQEDAGDRWLLAHCVAAQLLNCRCKEGTAIRRAIRAATVGVEAGVVPLALVSGLATMETRGRSYQWVSKKHLRPGEGKTMVRHKGLYYRRSTWHVAVSVDVVLVLAGLRSLLPAVLPVSD